jgi:hypothetical protein
MDTGSALALGNTSTVRAVIRTPSGAGVTGRESLAKSMVQYTNQRYKRNCSPRLNRRARCRRSIGRSVHAGRDFNRFPILVSTTSTENSSGSKPRSIHSDHPSTWERDGSAKAASKF